MSKPVIIDIGSGPHPKADATHRMDLHHWAGVTQVHDLRHIPYPYESDFADKVYFGDVIEHLTKFDSPKVLKEIRRIMKPGATLEVTCPDVLWIMTQIVEGTWDQNANVSWLRQNEDPWDNAMDYLFGGWRHPEEYKIPGMGHINGYCFTSLRKELEQAGFKDIERVADDRNPEPARWSVLKVVATK